MIRTEIENKVLKDSGAETWLSVMKLANIDITKNKRRESNIKMERDHVNRTIIVSEDPVIRYVATHLWLEGAMLCVEEFNKIKN